MSGFFCFITTMTVKNDSIRAVILDLDGTLVDTAEEIALALNETLVGLGLRVVSLEAATALIGRGVRSLVERAVDEVGATTDLDHAVEIFESHYERLVATRAILFPEAKVGLLAMRAAGLKIGVVTNKPRLFTEKLLRHLKVDMLFDTIVAGDDGLRRKPFGDMLVAAAKNMGARMDQTLMVGDSDNDVLAARNAGCIVWCVPYGYNEGRPADSLECDRMVATLLEAAHLL